MTMYRIICIALAMAACVVTTDDSTLTIENRSSYVLEEIYVAAVDDPSWGPNLLAAPLFPDEDLVVTNFECDTYDVLVVDETGVECELRGIDLCANDEYWTVDDFTLDVCAFAP